MTASLREAAQMLIDALHKMEVDRWSPWQNSGGEEVGQALDAAIESLIQRLALSDEPVLWRYKDSESVIGVLTGYTPGNGWTPLYAAPRPAAHVPEVSFGNMAEPVRWEINYTNAQGSRKTRIFLHNAIGDYRDIDPDATSTPLYAAPQPAEPKRPENCGTGFCSCIECLHEPKASKLYGWKVSGTHDLHTGDSAEADAKAVARRIGSHAFPLFTGAAPVEPKAMDRVPLTPAQCDEFRRHPGSFNEMVQAIFDAGRAAPVERQPIDLTDLSGLAKVYSTTYASPHHITFTVEGLRYLVEAAHGIKSAA